MISNLWSRLQCLPCSRIEHPSLQRLRRLYRGNNIPTHDPAPIVGQASHQSVVGQERDGLRVDADELGEDRDGSVEGESLAEPLVRAALHDEIVDQPEKLLLDGGRGGLGWDRVGGGLAHSGSMVARRKMVCN